MGKPKSLREAAEAGAAAMRKGDVRKPPIDLSLPHESIPAVRLAQTARAQQVMRSEMEAGMHKVVNPKLSDQPVTVSDVLDDLVGSPLHDQADVARMAHVLIEQYGAELRLGLKEFGIIQRIVEAAVRVDPSDL